MTESLIVESDEALNLARELAERRGMSVDAAVVEALRGSLALIVPQERPVPQPVRLLPLHAMTPEQRARYDRLRALTRKFAAYRVPGATSDHSEFYDENGLPI